MPLPLVKLKDLYNLWDYCRVLIFKLVMCFYKIIKRSKSFVVSIFSQGLFKLISSLILLYMSAVLEIILDAVHNVILRIILFILLKKCQSWNHMDDVHWLKEKINESRRELGNILLALSKSTFLNTKKWTKATITVNWKYSICKKTNNKTKIWISRISYQQMSVRYRGCFYRNNEAIMIYPHIYLIDVTNSLEADQEHRNQFIDQFLDIWICLYQLSLNVYVFINNIISLSVERTIFWNKYLFSW